MIVNRNKLTLTDKSIPFEVTLLEAVGSPRSIALFSVGAGGNPERHLPLMTALAEHGLTVIAPHFARLASPNPTDDDLLLRARRLQLAFEVVAQQESVVVGVGHSIGATVLLALAGAQLWMRQEDRLSINRDERLRKLALLAPATGFFQAPGALDRVRAPILAWAGTKDTITPPANAEFLKQALQGQVPVEVCIEDGAGHFSFMNVLPPNVEDPLSNRDAFLARLTKSVLSFALA